MNDWRQIHRRAVLGTVGASMAGIAGCTDLGVGGDDQNGSSGTDAENEEGQEEGNGEEEWEREQEWGEAIPTYPYIETASEPLNPQPDPEVDNPVITTDDVSDVNARFVADPFGFVDENGLWHMFFEVMDADDANGKIGHASSEDDGITWEYNQVIQEWNYHAAYPYVFKWDGNHYMIPQTAPADQPVELFQASSFPTDWYAAHRMFTPSEHDHGVNDFALFRYEGRWWFLGGVSDEHLVIWHAEELMGEWTYHERNPVVTDRPESTRPGGRPLVFEDGRIFYFTQRSDQRYGEELWANEILELSPETFEDEVHPSSPILAPTQEVDDEGEPTWNSLRMHHYDPWYLGEGEGWRCIVDGDRGDASGDYGDQWSIGIYRVIE